MLGWCVWSTLLMLLSSKSSLSPLIEKYLFLLASLFIQLYRPCSIIHASSAKWCTQFSIPNSSVASGIATVDNSNRWCKLLLQFHWHVSSIVRFVAWRNSLLVWWFSAVVPLLYSPHEPCGCHMSPRTNSISRQGLIPHYTLLCFLCITVLSERSWFWYY